MKNEAAVRAAALVRRCRVAALGTLHDGAPSVTMTPYALAGDPCAFVLLVSGLASHTKDMLADARVALMVVEPENADTPPHALARVSVQARSQLASADDTRYAAARSAYQQRFADMAGLFELGDFQLFMLEPIAVRVVLGFAQATSLTPQTLTTALRTAG